MRAPFALFSVLLALTVFESVIGSERPNIVYIVADDQSWSDFGFMGNSRVHTPNLDRLAAQSACFPNAYLTTSVCRPSLATLLTGLYPHQHGIHFNHGPPGNSGYNRITSREQYEAARRPEFNLINAVDTLPRTLSQKLSYRVLQTGKFWEGHWRNGGFTEGMTTFESPRESQTFGGARILASGERVAHGNGDHGLRIGRETMEPIESFILDCQREQTPWMLWYAPYLPHQPHDAPKAFYEIAARYPGVEPREIPYYASIAQFDETVGRLVRFVEKNAESKKTIFVFVSDNGWRPSEKPQREREREFAQTKRSKRSPFDDGLRSPILLRWDGVIPPSEQLELVSSIDIMPTLLRLVGFEAIDLPGQDLLQTKTPDRAVFGAVYPGDASSLGHPEKDVAYRWVRQGDWKLILPQGQTPWGNYLNEPALYNIRIDPRESVNRASDDTLTQLVLALRKKIDEWWTP